MTVLVLTRALDATSDLVIAELTDRGVPVHRLDPGDFPESFVIGAHIGPGVGNWGGMLRSQRRDLSLDSVHAVYYRRPSPFRLHRGMSAQDAQWAQTEARAGFGGVLSSLDCTWVNHPYHNAAAEQAPVALAVASRCGLLVPRTLITNDSYVAREFVDSLPGRIAAYKALGPGGPSDHDGKPHALWTTKVDADGINGSIHRTAHQFQQWINKAYEVRATWVAGRMFAAEIHTTSDAARADFRADYDDHTYKPCVVPADIANAVTALAGTFGLHYAALDFLVSEDDGHWYLVDVNPNGQWAFIPELRGAITRALADLLQGENPR
ncbi:ATP-grasp ribosomal peptide maturase [Streptomyces nigrescens]